MRKTITLGTLLLSLVFLFCNYTSNAQEKVSGKAPAFTTPGTIVSDKEVPKTRAELLQQNKTQQQKEDLNLEQLKAKGKTGPDQSVFVYEPQNIDLRSSNTSEADQIISYKKKYPNSEEIIVVHPEMFKNASKEKQEYILNHPEKYLLLNAQERGVSHEN